MERETDVRTDRQRDGWTDQTDKQMDGQTDR